MNIQDSNKKNLKWVGTRRVRPDGIDKVTGRAQFGADMNMPGQLVGRVLRSPHPHAIIKSIDTSRAEALPGVKAVVTHDDFHDLPSEKLPAGEADINFRDLVHNIIAGDKALYDGHAVAAVAATSAVIARRALKLIEVDYEPLPFAITLDQALADDAPILQPWLFTEGVSPRPQSPSNVAERLEMGIGDPDAAFAKADLVVERTFTMEAVHQGYIEPHACVASAKDDGHVDLWCTTQGHFFVRAACARLCDLDVSDIRVTASEIGGGFGGKTTIYLEPLAIKLSKKSGRPVKMVMNRDEVLRATGPTSGTKAWVKIGVMNDGTIVAADGVFHLEAGAFPGAIIEPAARCAFAPYDIADVRAVAYDVVLNRPKVAAYRAPGAPNSEYPVEALLDEIAEKLDMDPLELRLKNAAKEGTRTAYGPKFGRIGCVETLEAARAHPHYSAPLGPNQARGVATGYWPNFAGETSAAVNINEDGTATLMVGTPDIGGSRASICLMAAEELGVDYESIRPIIGDTGSLGFNAMTGGSRVTYSSGMAIVKASRDAVKEMCLRAAIIWGIPEDAVTWEDGHARPAGDNAGKFAPLSVAEIARNAGKTGGPIAGHAHINAQGPGASFGTHIVDVELDRETGRVDVTRYTVVQDAGRAVHPGHVEGQFQGGAVQGIGWALNEEYVYGEDGRLQNTGFLDYRMPVASDVPMIDTVIVEVPNERHPYGVRGVGETPIIPPLGAIANAVSRAVGHRLTHLPMSPPHVLAELKAAGGD
ncbi:MAG: xanthine dehydrogenase family protein molybdopterin-binding subunit [Hyphomicrobiales bacterium]|nr:xanthine dehydrogenase family protein molybdopterin-binding subunit [Hyphomicrobiales bacterium]